MRVSIQDMWKKHEEILHMRVLGFSVDEIASIVGIEIDAVSRYLASEVVRDRIEQKVERYVANAN